MPSDGGEMGQFALLWRAAERLEEAENREKKG